MSETEIFYVCPDVSPGKAEVSIQTDEVSIRQEINIVQLDLSVGKASLFPEEQTSLIVRVSGLEDIQEDIEVTLINESVTVITMEGGNNQIINISPSVIGEKGEWERTLSIKGLRRGNFAIMADISLPEEQPEEISDPQQIVDCDIDGYPVLVPAEICEQLQRDLPPQEESPAEYPPQEYIELEIPEVPNVVELGEEILINFKPDEGFLPHSVIFYIYDVADGLIEATIADTTPEDGYGFSSELGEEAGIYAIQTTVISGMNEHYRTTDYVIQQESLPGGIEITPELMSFNTSISNVDAAAERQRNRIRELERQRDENRRRAREEDSDAYEDARIVRQLERIDKVLENTEEAYSQKLRKLLDSIVRFPPVPDTAKLRAQLNRIQQALDACNDQLERLKQEKKDLEKELPDAVQKRLDAYHEITNLLRNSGYGFASYRKTNDSGDLEYSYGLILQNGSGYDYYKGALPVEIASDVMAQERLIKQLNQRCREIRERLAELPDIIESVQDECDRLKEEVNKAREALNEAKNLAGQYSHLHLQRDELCRQIKNLLNRLVLWCNRNPDLCSFKEQLEDFLDECPDDTLQVRRFWNMYNRLLTSKQGVEQEHREEAEQHSDNADEYRKRAQANEDGIDDAKDELEDLAEQRRRIQRQRAEAARQAAQRQREAEEREKQEEIDCLRKFAQWIADNKEHIDEDNLDALKPIVDGMRASAKVTAGIAKGMATGGNMAGATLSGLASGLFNLGASLFYGWVQSEAQAAVKKIADNYVMRLLEASLLNDNRKCGVIDPKGATSYFFFRKGNKLLIFRISATHGFEFLGEK